MLCNNLVVVLQFQRSFQDFLGFWTQKRVANGLKLARRAIRIYLRAA